ncbi:hypothetical protein N7456_011038 [Penicillium angulare]|uniref:Uncharacterized protein n=1 Tax=Penicillium angulare TaxID=116970 RepID=A0A9W9K0C2_9EURO|nr:hypothetical protein N7456_011038 [Penicillium angulare]
MESSSDPEFTYTDEDNYSFIPNTLFFPSEDPFLWTLPSEESESLNFIIPQTDIQSVLTSPGIQTPEEQQDSHSYDWSYLSEELKDLKDFCSPLVPRLLSPSTNIPDPQTQDLPSEFISTDLLTTKMDTTGKDMKRTNQRDFTTFEISTQGETV